MYFASVLITKSRLPLPASRPSWEKCKVDNSRRTISRSSISRSAFSALVRSTSDFHFPKAFQRWRGSGRVAQFPSPGVRSSPFLKMSSKMEQFPSSSFRLGAQEKDRQIFTKRLVYTQFPEGRNAMLYFQFP